MRTSQGDCSVCIITRYFDTIKELGESIADIRKKKPETLEEVLEVTMLTLEGELGWG